MDGQWTRGDAKRNKAVIEIGSFNGDVFCREEFLYLFESHAFRDSRVKKRHCRNQQDNNDACRHNKDTQNPSNSHLRLLAECARTNARRQGSNVTLFSPGLAVEDTSSSAATAIRVLSFFIETGPRDTCKV
jgi:hypothetical protein